MKLNKKVDIIILGVLLIMASIYAFLVDKTAIDIPVLSSYVFLIPPIVYLSVREKKDWRKIVATAFVLGFVIGFPFTFLGELTGAWAIHVAKQKMFGVFYFPIVIAWMLMTTLTVVLYQHFYIKPTNVEKGLSRRFNKITTCLVIISIVIVFVCLYKPSFFTKKYSYLIIGSVNLFPFLVYLLKRPKFIIKVIPLIVYFFVLYFSIEFVGLKLKWWSFEGSYIGYVNLIGITFPAEEFVYWMILYAPSTVFCYESFVNKRIG